MEVVGEASMELAVENGAGGNGQQGAGNGAGGKGQHGAGGKR